MQRLTADQAIKILQDHGYSATKQKAPAGTCRTLCYRVDGKPVNLGRLRRLAEALPYVRLSA